MSKNLILTFVFLIFFSQIQYSQCTLNEDFINITNSVQTLVFNEKFSDAIRIIDNDIKTNPNDCRYYFLKSAIYYWKDFVFNNDTQADNSFLKNIDITINLAIKRLKYDSKNPCLNFILGASYGYKGMYYLNKGSMFSTISNASKGVDYLNATLKLDSSFIDCYYGLGVYNYDAGKANFFIRLILPIFFHSADKEKGINYLEYVSNKGKISNYNADFTLALIFEHEGKYNRSRNYLKKLVLKYPRSSVFTVFLMINIFDYKKDYEEVKEIGQNFLHSTDEKVFIKKRFAGIFYWMIAKSYELLLNYQDALTYMKKCLLTGERNKTAIKSINFYKTKLDSSHSIGTKN